MLKNVSKTVRSSLGQAPLEHGATPGANPTTTIYNAGAVKIYDASAVKIYDAKGNPVRFENNKYFPLKLKML
jgi:hypothetical protein